MMSMSKGFVFKSLLPAMALAVTFALASDASAIKRAAGFGVDDFSNECGGSNLQHSAGFAEVFEDVFDSFASYTAEAYTNAQVDGRDFTDVDRNGSTSNARDYVYPTGADGNKVTLISSHGGQTNGSQSFRFTMGEDHANEPCKATSNSHIKLGNTSDAGAAYDGRTKIFIGCACRTAEKTIWDNNAFADLKDPDGLFRVYLSFHGQSFDTSKAKNNLEDYLSDSELNGLGDNWLSQMHWHRFGTNYDQCPVAVVWGESSADRDYMFDWGGFDDIKDVGRGTGATYYWLSGCYPNNGPTLPWTR